MDKAKIIQVGYVIIVVLSFLGVLELIGIADAYRFDRFALYLSMFIDVPLGALLLMLSLLIKWKDDSGTTKRNYVLGVGIVFGLLMVIVPPVLFLATG